MIALMSKRRCVATTLGVAAMLVILGCGDDSGLARRYPVSGTVKYKGQLLKKGQIAFLPVGPPMPEGRQAEGFIEDGSYNLTTATGGDGALPGDYKVIVFSSTLDTSQLVGKEGGPLHQGDATHVGALKAATSPIPTKYAREESTPLKAKVEATTNKFNFDLTD
jgi:hypothetical protein